MAQDRAQPFRRQPQLLRQILNVCPAAVASVARALHVRMPMQNGADRDEAQSARVLPAPPLLYTAPLTCLVPLELQSPFPSIRY